MGDSARIVKNIAILFVRMFMISAVVLYSSRVLLEYMGVEDFGVYSLIAGFIGLFSFMSLSLAISVQRHFSHEMGAGTPETLRNTFGAAVIIHFGLAFIILLLAGTIGFYLFDKYINVPPHSKAAADVLYFYVLITFCTKILCVPHCAYLMAKENMLVLSVADFAENLLKLLAAFALAWLPSAARMSYYGLFIAAVSGTMVVFYALYTYVKFSDCRYCVPKERKYYKNLSSFAMWNMISSFSVIAKLQGGTVILNIFFGPVANAAYGIANQVNSALLQFSSTITKAVNPQLMRKYAEKRYAEVNSIARASVKLIYFVVFTVALPLFAETSFIFENWLTVVPPNSVIFAKFFIIIILIDTLSNPLMSLMQATGRIAFYTTSVSLIQLLILPFAWFAFDAGCPEYSLFAITIAVSVVLLFVRVGFAHYSAKLDSAAFLKNVLLRIAIMTAACAPILVLTHLIESGLLRFLAVCALSVPLSATAFWFAALSDSERLKVKNAAFKKAAAIICAVKGRRSV